MTKIYWKTDPQTDCWNWQLYIERNGYGRWKSGGRPHQAHRVMYKRAVGPIPDGMEIDHLCRNRACVNPDHLRAVTHAANQRREPVSKLTLDKAREIRARYAEERISQRQLAAEYGVNQNAIWMLLQERTWKEGVV
jgi:hypothetical protein